MLAYADLVLVSTNTVTAIAYNTFLSIKFLGESFIPKYDLPAFSLLGIGAIIITRLASTSEKHFTESSIIEMIT